MIFFKVLLAFKMHFCLINPNSRLTLLTLVTLNSHCFATNRKAYIINDIRQKIIILSVTEVSLLHQNISISKILDNTFLSAESQQNLSEVRNSSVVYSNLIFREISIEQ